MGLQGKQFKYYTIIGNNAYLVTYTSHFHPSQAIGSTPDTRFFNDDYAYYWKVAKEMISSLQVQAANPPPPPPPTNNPPVAKAMGPSSPVKPGDTVVLDGSSSSDPDNGPQPLTYEWTQTSGSPTVSLQPDNKAVKPSFTAPTVNTATILKFQLVVSDGKDSSATPSNVDITVLPSTSGGGGGGGGGAGATSGSMDAAIF